MEVGINMIIQGLGPAVREVGEEVQIPSLHALVPYIKNTPEKIIICWENLETIIYSYFYHDQYYQAVQKVFEIVQKLCGGCWDINSTDQQVYDRILRRFYLFREDYPEEKEKGGEIKNDPVFSI